MSRALFGTWGSNLSQEDFAQAVAGVGVLGTEFAALEEAAIRDRVLDLQSEGYAIVTFSLATLARSIGMTRDRASGLASAERFRDAWNRFRDLWYQEAPRQSPFMRLEVDPAVRREGSHETPDALWTVRLLQGEGRTVADSVYLRVDEPDRAIAWEWPLRVGVLGDVRSQELAECVATIPWPQLVKLIQLDAADEDCDLLLLPDDLRGAAARVLKHSRRLRADCVLLVGGAGVSQDRIEPLVHTLRTEVLTGGVAFVRVEAECERAWVTRLFEELSHDLPFDVALVQAHGTAVNDEPSEPPLLIGSRRLAVNIRISAFAGRYGGQLRRMAAGRAARPPAAGGRIERRRPAAPWARELDAAGEQFEQSASEGRWLSESADASEVPRMREQVEAAVGASLPAERDGAPKTAELRQDQRRVNFSVRDVTEPDAASAVRDRLAPDRAYEMALYIGLPRAEVESASETFPSEKLPPSRDGHWLDVFFVPLVRAASGRFHTPQQARLFLPPHADSEPCTLSFRTHGVAGEYRARILVAHENRIIQTLIFSSPLVDTSRRFKLDVENVVAPTFDPAWQGKPFDAAIVVNHTAEGQAGFTTVVGKEVSFREPQGIDKLVSEVKTLLSAEATFKESRGSLDDPALLALMDNLAHYGRSILKPMPAELQGRVPEGARIQVVEARSGAWLPVEVFYSARLPQAGATLCPNARGALLREQGVSHESCAHRDDRKFHCPMRFWGFNCVIERQPAVTPPPGADFTISVPRAGEDRLDAFRSALIGASRNVRAKDLTDPGGILEAVTRVTRNARSVKNWEEWESAVESDSPSLLVLLPHSQEDPAHPGISALEIGGALLTYPELESCHVAGPAAKSPVVLLLGCSTQLTDVPFLNFVEAFKREKAALVIGTLAIIRGRRAVAFVSALLDGLKAAAGSDRTFGDVFLETKRRLLADGDGFVLSLTAYGDVGWRL